MPSQPLASPALSSRHLPALDGIRGLAIALVLAHNTQMLEEPHGLAARATEFLLDRGWIGVQLFFVLSGFLISGILLDTQRSPHYFRSFFGRRALRIFPLYYLALLVSLVLLPTLGVVGAHPAPHFIDQIPLWLYFSNWSGPLGWGGDALPHFWSLAVEEQFYLIWPFVLYRLSATQTFKLCLGVAAATLLIRVGMLMAGASHEMVYSFSVCRMDALALGAAAAAALRMPGLSGTLRRRQGLLLGGALALAALAVGVTHGLPRAEQSTQTAGYSLLALAFALLILHAAQADLSASGGSATAALLRWAPLRTLGRYSYGIYVIHKPLHDLLGKPLVAAWGVPLAGSAPLAMGYVLACALVSLMLAMLSYHGIEKRFLALKRYFVAAG